MDEQINRIAELEQMLSIINQYILCIIEEKNEEVIDKHQSNVQHMDQNKQILEEGRENAVNLMVFLFYF